MGLNDSLLNVPERLRVWQQAGIRYFYVDPLAEAVAEIAPERESALQAEPAPDVAPEPVKPPVQVGEDPAAWPKPWPAIFAKAPEHPRIVLTYEALSLDMTGRADPRRGKLWRRLIQELDLSGANAVAFWPYCLPDAAERERDTAIFLTGLRLMRPAVLAVFGALSPETTKSWHGHLPDLEPVVLADPERLLGGDMEAWHDALDALGGG
ncbi:hypothetical protein DesfrDRAFT_1568 [Solidesulfovibrio fructosivorans JJ]]|uniref:Uncharacterized protein n=1 Tax=Solidesulfovibrio fructosivorans JJ] TaxID=596151 RepID=E1JVB9_SOLFR|nr:hypothetical protein [Solidesulfovibrio fructosivorans]EFL51713.1 hypothetical protein DesfrDRAFT_1568 [Solidesulfovibrio fructosivorans JJ]]